MPHRRRWGVRWVDAHCGPTATPRGVCWPEAMPPRHPSLPGHGQSGRGRGCSWLDPDGASELKRRGIEEAAGLVYLGAGLPAGCDAAVHDDVSGLPVEGAGERGVEAALAGGDLPVAAELNQHGIARDEVAGGVDRAGCGTTGGAFKLPRSHVVLVKGDV